MADIVMRLRSCINYGERLPVNATVLQLLADAAVEIETLRLLVEASSKAPTI